MASASTLCLRAYLSMRLAVRRPSYMSLFVAVSSHVCCSLLHRGSRTVKVSATTLGAREPRCGRAAERHANKGPSTLILQAPSPVYCLVSVKYVHAQNAR